MALIKDYFEKTHKYINEYGKKTIVLMQVGAFFEVYGLKKLIDNSIYGSEIMEFSKICDLNVVDKKICVGSEPVKMAGFKEMFIDKYVKKLQESGFTSIVFTQDDPLQNPLGEITRSLAGIFSPGTYFSCDTEIITNNSCCIWLYKTKKTILNNLNNEKSLIYIGISSIDIYTGKTSLFEFNQIYINNPSTFDELERIISCYNPSETIIIYNFDKNLVDDIVSYTNIQSNLIHYINLEDDVKNNINTKRAINCEKQVYQKELLEKIYKMNDFNSFIQFYENCTIALQSLCYLLDFIYQHNPNLIYRLKEPIIELIGDKLILANHSLKQLNIIDDQYKGKYSSVLKMLNECITPMGRRKFSFNFLNPITNEIFLQNEYNIIEYCIPLNDLFNKIKSPLIQISDLTKLYRQIIIKKISPKNLYQLSQSLLNIKNIGKMIELDVNIQIYLNYKINGIKNNVNKDLNNNYIIKFNNDDIDNINNINYKNNNNLIELNNLIDELLNFLDQHLYLDLCQDIDNIHKFDINIIKRGIDNELDEKMDLLIESENKLEACRKYFNDLIADYENKSKNKNNKTESIFVKINETEKNNYSLIATERRCKILDEIFKKMNFNKVILNFNTNDFKQKEFELNINKGTIEYLKQTASNKCIYSNEINEICKKVANLKNELINIIYKVYFKIMNKLSEFQNNFEFISEFIAIIDVVFTKSNIAKKYGYCKPIINSTNEKSFIDVKQLRHCLIENIQQSEIYIANDVQLGFNKDNENKDDGILLYGTNAVGKTSFIRSLGIAVIMAQSGLFVPATSFIYKPYKYIFTRILGNDNIFKGLSTFAVEMSELNTILRLANENSLILGDELCSGTESISATSIFVSGIQHLSKLKSSFIFATHLHEIISFDEIESLKNVKLKHMSVYFDKSLNLLIYDRLIKDGPGHNMYGLEVCKSLNLPNDFLENANNLRLKYHPESASILDNKQSIYNNKYLKGICEGCNKSISQEIHHLQHQKDANDDNFINTKNSKFHKNHAANLLRLCKVCHDKIHKNNSKPKKTKTNKGIKII